MKPSFWSGRRVYITGHTGFKGSWLSYWLSKVGAIVTGFALAPETTPNLFDGARLAADLNSEIGNICDGDLLRESMANARPDIVFHLAAQPLVRRSYDDPIATFEINAVGTARVLEAIRSAPTVRAVVCVTTDKCYENHEWVWPYREIDRLGGADPYAASKACAELIVSSYRRSFFSGDFAARIATARGGNVIGGGDWSEDRIVPDLIRSFIAGRAANIRNPTSVRPWQFVLDALNGYIMLAEHLFASPPDGEDAWNIGPPPSSELTVEEVANAVVAGWGEGASWLHVPEKASPHEASVLRLDSSKARSRLGWRDLVPATQAIAQTAEWYRRYQAGASPRELMDDAIDDFKKKMESPF